LVNVFWYATNILFNIYLIILHKSGIIYVESNTG